MNKLALAAATAAALLSSATFGTAQDRGAADTSPAREIGELLGVDQHPGDRDRDRGRAADREHYRDRAVDRDRDRDRSAARDRDSDRGANRDR